MFTVEELLTTRTKRQLFDEIYPIVDHMCFRYLILQSQTLGDMPEKFTTDFQKLLWDTEAEANTRGESGFDDTVSLLEWLSRYDDYMTEKFRELPIQKVQCL